MQLIAIDFDGTIVEHKFPEIGEPLPGAFEVMKELQGAGYGLILNTCREDDAFGASLADALHFCRVNGIDFRSANCNHQDDEFRRGLARKVFAHHYIDDRNLGGFKGWAWVRRMLLTKGGKMKKPRQQ